MCNRMTIRITISLQCNDARTGTLIAQLIGQNNRTIMLITCMSCIGNLNPSIVLYCLNIIPSVD